MFDLFETLATALAGPISSYDLTMIRGGNDAVFIVGKGYALSISLDRDYALLGMVRYDEKSKRYMWHSANQLLAERAAHDQKDRKDPIGLDAQLEASASAIIYALKNRCQDLLRGDFSWLDLKIKKDPLGWSGKSLPMDVQSMLVSAMNEKR
jgi:hypothetical protein